MRNGGAFVWLSLGIASVMGGIAAAFAKHLHHGAAVAAASGAAMMFAVFVVLVLVLSKLGK